MMVLRPMMRACMMTIVRTMVTMMIMTIMMTMINGDKRWWR